MKPYALTSWLLAAALAGCGSRAILGPLDQVATPDVITSVDATDDRPASEVGVVLPTNDAPAGDGASQSSVTPTCPSDLFVCNGVCVDVMADPNHCGSCGAACEAGRVCDLGRCVVFCGGERSACGGACVNTSTNIRHCGACDHACRNDQRCESGACRCPAGLTDCGGFCSDTRSDTNHCGGCGVACARPRLCSESECVCPVGLSECQGQCIDFTSNTNHCGACAVRCGPGQECVEGRCV